MCTKTKLINRVFMNLFNGSFLTIYFAMNNFNASCNSYFYTSILLCVMVISIYFCSICQLLCDTDAANKSYNILNFNSMYC